MRNSLRTQIGARNVANSALGSFRSGRDQLKAGADQKKADPDQLSAVRKRLTDEVAQLDTATTSVLALRFHWAAEPHQEKPALWQT